MSIVRRAGRAAIAIASWLAVVAIVVAASRWYRRRERTPSGAWLLLLVPYVLVGWAWFSRLLADSARIHTWWLVLPCVIVWCLAFVVVARITARDGVRRYHVVQTRVPTETADAYRGGVPVPQKSIDDLVSAWQCAGLAVLLKGDELRVSNLEGATAFVPAPASGAFGAGETFEVRTENPALLLAMLPPAAALLGELRWQRAG